jgi:CubicO group peptidase (beta-lactamase class C family)
MRYARWTVRSGTLVVAGFLSTFVSPTSAQPGPLQGLDAYVERALREWNAPGVAVAVIREGRIIHAQGYGVREVGRPDRVDEHTVFAVGSTTKAFTSAALAILVDEGKMGWDDRATTHLPGFQLSDPYVTRELTVRDLLTHRSGLPRGDQLWYSNAYDASEVLRRVRFLEPAWGFRAHYGYQNIMFAAAGEVVHRVSGVSWGDFVQRRLFEPLGMTRSYTSVAPLSRVENTAAPHVWVEGVPTPVPWKDLDNVGPAGSINSSVRDMAVWLRMHLAGGEHEGVRLLGEDRVREMQAPQTVIRLPQDQRELFPEVNFAAYGLAWSLRDYRGRKLVGHGGGIDGMRAEVMMVPEESLGVVVLSNIGGSAFPQAIIYRVLDHYLGSADKDWSALLLEHEARGRERARESRARREAQRVSGTRPSLPLDRYAGIYADSLYGELRVEVEGGALAVRHGADYHGDLAHWHFDTFEVTWRRKGYGTAFVTFLLDGRGNPTRLEVEGLASFGRRPDPAPAPAAGMGGAR